MARRNRSNKRRLDRRRQLDELGLKAAQLARRAAPYLLMMLIGIGVPLGLHQAYLRAVTGQTFELATIQVKGERWLTAQQIATKGQLAAGLNLLDLDLEATQASLEREPWIKRARLERVMPDTLIVHVQEHEPVAVVVDGEQLVLVDREGEPFKVIGPEDPMDKLLGSFHLITGTSQARLQAQSPTSASERRKLIQAFEALSGYHELGLVKLARVSEVHLDPVLGVSLILEQSGVEVRLGWGRYRERLRRFAQVYESLVEKDVQVDYILIDQEEDLSRVAVGLAMTKDGTSPRTQE